MKHTIRSSCMHVCMYIKQDMLVMYSCVRETTRCWRCLETGYSCLVCMCACMKNTHDVCTRELQRALQARDDYVQRGKQAEALCACMRNQHEHIVYSCVHAFKTRNKNTCVFASCIHVCMYATHTMRARVKHSERCRQQALSLVWRGKLAEALHGFMGS